MLLYSCLIFSAVGFVLIPFYSDTAMERLIERIGSIKYNNEKLEVTSTLGT